MILIYRQVPPRDTVTLGAKQKSWLTSLVTSTTGFSWFGCLQDRVNGFVNHVVWFGLQTKTKTKKPRLKHGLNGTIRFYHCTVSARLFVSSFRYAGTDQHNQLSLHLTHIFAVSQNFAYLF